MSTDRTVAGFDTGGTFTDFVLQNERGELQIWKRLSTPARASEAVFTGLTECWGPDLGGLALILGSTTLVSNCVIERKGADTALVTTAGHPDILEIGRELRADLYDLLIDRVTPLIPRARVFELRERIGADGRVITPLDPDGVQALFAWLDAAPVASVAVCLLHAYRNPAHEEHIGTLLAARYPELCISLSSQVAPEIREYERASTLAINAYAQPAIKSYLDGLKTEFAERGFRGAFLMMASHGGLLDNDAAARFPVRLMESGPAAGALAAAHVAPHARTAARSLVRHGRHDGEAVLDLRRSAGPR